MYCIYILVIIYNYYTGNVIRYGLLFRISGTAQFMHGFVQPYILLLCMQAHKFYCMKLLIHAWLCATLYTTTLYEST